MIRSVDTDPRRVLISRMKLAADSWRDPIGRLRIAGFFEGSTFLALLFVAMPLKYLGGWPLGVEVLGPIHGVAFLLYCVFLVENVAGGGWGFAAIMRAGIAAVLPFGTFLNDPWLLRHGALIGNRNSIAAPGGAPAGD